MEPVLAQPCCNPRSVTSLFQLKWAITHFMHPIPIIIIKYIQDRPSNIHNILLFTTKGITRVIYEFYLIHFMHPTVISNTFDCE